MSHKNVDAKLVGIVGKPHGIKGEVNVMLLTDYPDSILEGSVLYTADDCSKKMIIEKIALIRKKRGETAVVKFEGISDRNGADAIRGSELYRSPEECPVLDSGEFWIEDLEGCTVCLDDGTVLGKVEKVEEIPSNENLIIRLEDKDIEISGASRGLFCVPFIDDYIKSIDIIEKKIILKKIPEYI